MAISALANASRTLGPDPPPRSFPVEGRPPADYLLAAQKACPRPRPWEAQLASGFQHPSGPLQHQQLLCSWSLPCLGHRPGSGAIRVHVAEQPHFQNLPAAPLSCDKWSVSEPFGDENCTGRLHVVRSGCIATRLFSEAIAISSRLCPMHRHCPDCVGVVTNSFPFLAGPVVVWAACEHDGRHDCRTQAAAFVKAKLVDGGTGRLRRSFRLNASEAGGYADDYAHLIEGLLDLFQVHPSPSCSSKDSVFRKGDRSATSGCGALSHLRLAKGFVIGGRGSEHHGCIFLGRLCLPPLLDPPCCRGGVCPVRAAFQPTRWGQRTVGSRFSETACVQSEPWSTGTSLEHRCPSMGRVDEVF